MGADNIKSKILFDINVPTGGYTPQQAGKVLSMNDSFNKYKIIIFEVFGGYGSGDNFSSLWILSESIIYNNTTVKDSFGEYSIEPSPNEYLQFYFRDDKSIYVTYNEYTRLRRVFGIN